MENRFVRILVVIAEWGTAITATAFAGLDWWMYLSMDDPLGPRDLKLLQTSIVQLSTSFWTVMLYPQVFTLMAIALWFYVIRSTKSHFGADVRQPVEIDVAGSSDNRA